MWGTISVRGNFTLIAHFTHRPPGAGVEGKKRVKLG